MGMLSSTFWLRRRRRWISSLMVVLYLVCHSAAPAGPAAIQMGCRCDHILQATGNCCCCARKGASQPSTSTKESCCARRAAPRRSCCQSRKNCSHEDEKTSRSIQISACSCGSPSDAGYLMNSAPRTLSGSSPLLGLGPQTESCLLQDVRIFSRSFAPEPPPPRSSFC